MSRAVPQIEIQARLLNYRYEIRCKRCGKMAWSHHSKWDVICPAAMVDAELRRNLPMPNMPVGWCMNGRDHLVCDTCMTQSASSPA